MPAAPAPAVAYPPAGQLDPLTTAPQPAAYPQDAYPPATYQTPSTPMQYPSYVASATPQKNMLVYVSSIILIVLTGILLVPVLAIALAAAAGGGSAGAAFAVILIIFVIIAVGLFVVAGILGLRNCADPSKGMMLFILGCIMAGLMFLSVVSSLRSGGSWLLPGLVVAGLYAWGGWQLKSQA